MTCVQRGSLEIIVRRVGHCRCRRATGGPSTGERTTVLCGKRGGQTATCSRRICVRRRSCGALGAELQEHSAVDRRESGVQELAVRGFIDPHNRRHKRSHFAITLRFEPPEPALREPKAIYLSVLVEVDPETWTAA